MTAATVTLSRNVSGETEGRSLNVRANVIASQTGQAKTPSHLGECKGASSLTRLFLSSHVERGLNDMSENKTNFRSALELAWRNAAQADERNPAYNEAGSESDRCAAHYREMATINALIAIALIIRELAVVCSEGQERFEPDWTYFGQRDADIEAALRERSSQTADPPEKMEDLSPSD